MTIKKFLVQVVSAPDTRWMESDEVFKTIMAQAVAEEAYHITAGPTPGVGVILEEQSEAMHFPAVHHPECNCGGYCPACAGR